MHTPAFYQERAVRREGEWRHISIYLNGYAELMEGKGVLHE
jgi:hypothetical protein